MNRTGLFIALALAVVIELLFGIYPEFDLKLAALFYDPATKSFPLKFNTLAVIARDAAMWISWGMALPALVALVAKLVRPERPLLMSGRALVFLLVTLILSAGVLTNLMGQTIEDLQRHITHYRDALAEHGHDPAKGRVTVLLHTFLDEDTERARATAAKKA